MNSRERVLAHLAGQPVDRMALMPITMQFACDLIGAKYRDDETDHRVLVEGQMRVAEQLKKLADGLHGLGARVLLHIRGNTRFALAGMGQLGWEIPRDTPTGNMRALFEFLSSVAPDRVEPVVRE